MKDKIIEILKEAAPPHSPFGEHMDDWEKRYNELLEKCATRIASLSSGVSEKLSMFDDDSNEGNIKRSELIKEQRKFRGDNWKDGEYSQGFADCFNWISKTYETTPAPQKSRVSEGEILGEYFIEDIDRFIPHLTPKARMYWKEGAEFIRERLRTAHNKWALSKPPKPISDLEIDELYSGYVNESGIMERADFKAAIKELYGEKKGGEG